jgi:hypothetical protein
LTDEDERILDAAAAKRWRERQAHDLAPGNRVGDESIKLTAEDERALDLAWAKVRERRQACAAAEQEQAPPPRPDVAGE